MVLDSANGSFRWIWYPSLLQALHRISEVARKACYRRSTGMDSRVVHGGHPTAINYHYNRLKFPKFKINNQKQSLLAVVRQKYLVRQNLKFVIIFKFCFCYAVLRSQTGSRCSAAAWAHLRSPNSRETNFSTTLMDKNEGVPNEILGTFLFQNASKKNWTMALLKGQSVVRMQISFPKL